MPAPRGGLSEILFYEEFYLNNLRPDENMEQRIDAMINKSKPKNSVEESKK